MHTKQPLVSIVIPAYNRAGLIGETLDSVKNQTYSNWECIVVDDGSSDDTVEVIREYIENEDRFQLMRRERMPKGGSVCRNIGLEKAKGAYVLFLDSDDLLASDALKERMEVVETHPDYDAWVFRGEVFAEHIGDLNQEIIYREELPDLYGFIKHSIPLPWCITAPLWKKDVLNTLGGFDERFPRLQDPELHTRALLKGVRFYKAMDKPINFYIRRHRRSKEVKIGQEQQYEKFRGVQLYIDFLLEVSKKREDYDEIKKLLVQGFTAVFKSCYRSDLKSIDSLLIEIINLLREKNIMRRSQAMAYKLTIRYPFLKKVKGLRGILWRMY